MPHKEPFVRHFLCHFAVYAHNFYLKPYARYHTVFPDFIGHLFKTVRETAAVFLPLAHAVPPETIRIPAAINAVILASCLCGGFYKRHFLFFGRVAPKTVHIVIENNRQLFVIGIPSAYRTAVSCKLAHTLVKVTAYADCNRNRRKALPGSKVLEPVRLLFVRSAERKVKMSSLVAYLPVPRAVMLYLPEKPVSCFGVLNITHR